MRWLTLPGPERPVSTGSSRRVGRTDVDAVQTMAGAFRDLLPEWVIASANRCSGHSVATNFAAERGGRLPDK